MLRSNSLTTCLFRSIFRTRGAPCGGRVIGFPKRSCALQAPQLSAKVAAKALRCLQRTKRAAFLENLIGVVAKW